MPTCPSTTVTSPPLIPSTHFFTSPQVWSDILRGIQARGQGREGRSRPAGGEKGSEGTPQIWTPMVRTAPYHREEGLVSVCVCTCAVIHLSFLSPPSVTTDLAATPVPSPLDHPHTTLSSPFPSLFPCSKSENRQWLVGVPPVLARTREEANLAVRRISRELVWKIHFEKAQVTWIRHSVCYRPALQWSVENIFWNSCHLVYNSCLLHSITISVPISFSFTPFLFFIFHPYPYPYALCPSVSLRISQAEERAADCAALGMYHLAPKCSALKGEQCGVCVCVRLSPSLPLSLQTPWTADLIRNQGARD
jgi:hypothetical protein